MNKKFDVQKVFNEVRVQLKRGWDFEPTLIELVRLRHYVADSVENFERLENPSSEWGFDPDGEAIVRFFSDLYAVPIEYHYQNVGEFGRKFRQYLKIKQEKAHYP